MIHGIDDHPDKEIAASSTGLPQKTKKTFESQIELRVQWHDRASGQSSCEPLRLIRDGNGAATVHQALDSHFEDSHVSEVFARVLQPQRLRPQTPPLGECRLKRLEAEGSSKTVYLTGLIEVTPAILPLEAKQAVEANLVSIC